MDKQNLSKYKYIYRIYEDRTGAVHCTKHPVVYINSKVVYFKDARKQEYLGNTSIDGVSDDFASYAQNVLNSLYHFNVNNYFWNIEDNIIELFREFKKQIALARIIQNEKQITARYVQAQKEFEAAKTELMKLVSAKEN